MESQNSQSIWTIVLSIAATAIIVGGGFYFWQQTQTNALRQEIQDLKTQKKELAEEKEVLEDSAADNNGQALLFIAQINQLLKEGADIQEIDNPNLILPPDINPGQIEKYFKMGDILFALALRNSMNVYLSLPDGFSPAFGGVLVAKQGDTQWTTLLEIKDVEVTNKNNPYYLTVENQKLLLTVVDQTGAGSGEGMMKVFALSETDDWKLESCYYFGGSYRSSETDGDYFAFSTKFSKQTPQPIENCDNVQLISHE